MKFLSNKLLLSPIKTENKWGYEDKEEVKKGTIVFPFKNDEVELSKGDEVYYQYGTPAKIDGKEYVLVRDGDLICKK